MRAIVVAGGLALAGCFGIGEGAVAQEAAPAESWLPSLVTDTPEEGFALAVTLSRKGVTTTQPEREVLFMEREKYSRDADSLIAASQTIALHFQTIAAANDYWR